jgi:predicted branched-subunit amino acid permease
MRSAAARAATKKACRRGAGVGAAQADGVHRALSPKVRQFSTGQRMLIAAFLVDNSFAFMQKRELDRPNDPHLIAYYAGLTAVFWPSWLLFCVIGIFAGNIVPASWQLEFAIPLSFIAILVGSVRSVPMAAAAVVGGFASVLLFSLPLKLGLVVACLAGLLAGVFAEKGVHWWTSHKAG